METLSIYLIKSSVLLFLFFCTYFFLLKKNTFFTTNRWFLLFGIVCSLILPLISIQKTVWIEPLNTSLQTLDLNNATAGTTTPILINKTKTISWEIIVGLLYGTGIIVFLTQLLIEFYSLRKIIKRQTKKQLDGLHYIEIQEAVSPFSFFKKIVYNPDLFQPEELENIIEHEKIHAKQLHSLDVLVARLHCILFWWNPLVWFYKKAIIQNLEFIADQNALAKTKDKKSYLLTLLKITTAEKHVAITNHFYQSLIKKRIVMLHKNQSKKHHSWKYFTVVPALVFFIMTYQVEVVAQTKSVEKEIEVVSSSKISFTFDATTKEEEIQEHGAFLKKEFGALLELKKITRNKYGEIKTIRLKLSKNHDIKIYEVVGTNPIKPFTIFFETDSNNQQTFGFSAPKENQHLKQHFEAVEKAEKFQKEETITYTDETEENQEEYEMGFYKTSAAKDNITLLKEDKNTDYKKAFISLNGKEISVEDMEKIDSENIGSISILKSNNNDQLVAKYGERARNGVILIETMDFEKPIEEQERVKEKFKIDSDNGGFIIHMRSQNSDIEFYKKELNKIGVEVKISGIERNINSFITAVKIKLIDRERGQKMSANWENSNGIPAISIGRKKGKLILTSN